MTKNFLFKIINYLILILFCVLPFIFTSVNEELFEFPKMIVVYLLVIWLGFFTILYILKRQKITLSGLDLVILGYLLSQILSTIFSIHQRTSLFGYYSRQNGGLFSTLAYTILYFVFLQFFNQVKANKLINQLCLVGLVVSLYAILEHFGYSLSCLFIRHEFNTSCWIQDVQNRVFASFGQPNWLAAFLVMILPFSIPKIFQKQSKGSEKIKYLIISFCLFASLIFTKSRSAILAFLIALFLQIILHLIIKQKKKLIFLLISTLVILAFIVLSTGFNAKSNSFQTKATSGGTESLDIRKIVWQGAIKVWQRYPLFGSGVATFGYSYYQDRPLEHNLTSEWDFLYNKAHNELLDILANSGIIGLISYLLIFIVIIFYNAKYLGKLNSEDQATIISLDCALLALFISNFFGFSTVYVNVLMYFFFALLVILFNKQQIIALPTLKKNLFMETGKIVNFTCCLYLSFSVSKIWLADKAFVQAKELYEAGEYQDSIKVFYQAITLSKREALFYDELASTYANLALSLSEIDETEASQEFAKAALETSDIALKLNNRHLNFYKTRARILIKLSITDKQYLKEAEEVLLSAISLAPTDAKLYYYLAIVKNSLGENEAAIKILKNTIEIKANYAEAVLKLAEIYEETVNYQEALNHYQIYLHNFDSQNEEIKAKIKILEASMSGEKNNQSK